MLNFTRVWQFQGDSVSVSGDAERAQGDVAWRDDTPRRAQDRARPVDEPATLAAHERLAACAHVVVQGEEDEGHLPHDEHVPLRSEEHDRRVLDTGLRDQSDTRRARQGDRKPSQQAHRQLMLKYNVLSLDDRKKWTRTFRPF